MWLCTECVWLAVVTTVIISLSVIEPSLIFWYAVDMKHALRARAIKLRESGWSYNVIQSRLGVSKSTLSHWLRETPYTPNQSVIRRINTGLLKSVLFKHDQKMRSILTAKAKGKKEIGGLSKRDLLLLGLGIYMGEGTKLYEEIRVINANPDIIRSAVKWFRDIFDVPRENFSLLIHIYPDNSEKVALEYWSKVTSIPLTQFGKTQIDVRTNKSKRKHRMLPYGTAHLKVKSCGNAKFGVLLHRRIMGQIEAAHEQMRV